jgi:hypothetical protein
LDVLLIVLGLFAVVRICFAADRLPCLSRQVSPRLYFGGVTRDRADDASVERAVDQRRMHFNSPMKKSRFDQAASGATVMTSAAICASHAATTTTMIATAA